MIISKYYLIQYKNQTILQLMKPTKQKINFSGHFRDKHSSQGASALLFFSPSSQVVLTAIAASSLNLSKCVPLHQVPARLVSCLALAVLLRADSYDKRTESNALYSPGPFQDHHHNCDTPAQVPPVCLCCTSSSNSSAAQKRQDWDD